MATLRRNECGVTHRTVVDLGIDQMAMTEYDRTRSDAFVDRLRHHTGL